MRQDDGIILHVRVISLNMKEMTNGFRQGL